MNIYMLVIDSLRADHMSCYGYDRLTTPHIDELADQGVLFERIYCPHVPTTSGYGTMLCYQDSCREPIWGSSARFAF